MTTRTQIREQADRDRVYAYLATKGTKDQLVSFIVSDLNMGRGHVLKTLRTLDREGLAVRLYMGGWVLTRHKGARMSEFEAAVIDVTWMYIVHNATDR